MPYSRRIHVRVIAGATTRVENVLMFRYGILLACLFFSGTTLSQMTVSGNSSTSSAKAAANFEELMRSAPEGQVESVRKLITDGVDVNGIQRGETALQLIAWVDHGESTDAVIAQMLIDAGARVDVRDKNGLTPLMLAARSNNPGIVKVLMDVGAGAKATDSDISTALTWAAGFGSVEMTRMLLPRSSTNAKAKALATARMGCDDDVAALLLQGGAVDPPGERNHAPNFSDFRVKEIYKGVPASVDLSSSGAREFRTRLREGARKGPNFAGHFTIVQWGCGSNCETTVVVDALSGQVVEAGSDDRGADFRRDSGLLILDPASGPDAYAYEDDPSDSLPVRYYAWKQNKLEFLYSEPCWVVNGHQACGCKAKPKVDAAQATKP